MNKVKITVLKTTFDKELAERYGAAGIGACPMLKEGQVFYASSQNRRAFATRRGRRSINTCSPSPTA